VVGSISHSGNIWYLVGQKTVYVRPSCQRFLRELGNVAGITIWSSMRVATVKFVCDLLFKDLLIKLVNILNQESCERIRVCNTHGKVSFLKVKGFCGFEGRYAKDNIIIVDDSPPKHVLNPSENVILPETWTFVSANKKDAYLMDTLLPWILQLHMRAGYSGILE
jgi:hypothetical protein